jgi:CHASE2 domain-containing sensor protein
MERLLVLNLGNGNGKTGLPSIIAQLWENPTAQPMQISGNLPAMPDLDRLLQQWQTLYFALYAHLGWRRARAFEFEIDEAEVTHISQAEFVSVCQQLQTRLNQWLNSDGFQQIQRRIRTYLSPEDSIRIVITANDVSLLQLPWHLWQLLEDYPEAEIALSPAEYARSRHTVTNPSQEKVRILAILGNSQGIDVDYDRRILSQLPQAEIEWLIEPTSEQLQAELWEQQWDLLFFAGHSSSQGKGCMQINGTETLTIDQLKYGLKRAIAKGLKLAIFNSCDGLGLAQDLADLSIPQVIVMRQPVPDHIAQAFLKTFLQNFSAGHSLYYSVREAREKLQLLESEFPCATWLPVICQNPAEPAARWADWCQPRRPIKTLKTPIKSWRKFLKTAVLPIALGSVVSTGLTLGAKSLNWLQPIELAAYDQLMRMRPIEAPDPRLLIVTITEADIQKQGDQPRPGSLSDQRLEQLIKILNQAQSRVIGLDFYRDFPTRSTSLKAFFKDDDRLITICKRPDVQVDPTGVNPSPDAAPDSIGFSDFIQDRDSVIRRHLIAMDPQSTTRCQTGNAFSTLLALRYLADSEVPIAYGKNALRIDQRLFKSLNPDAFGYEAQDLQGLQGMLNYRRTAQGIAQTVTLDQLLSQQVPTETIRNRIVLIGGVNPSSNDRWATPFGMGFAEKQPGVVLHAQMISQILSAVQDERPLLYPIKFPQFLLLLFLSAIGGGAIGLIPRSIYRWLLFGCAFAMLYGIAWFSLPQGWWMPIGMPMLSLTGTTLLVSASHKITRLSLNELQSES